MVRDEERKSLILEEEFFFDIFYFINVCMCEFIIIIIGICILGIYFFIFFKKIYVNWFLKIIVILLKNEFLVFFIVLVFIEFNLRFKIFVRIWNNYNKIVRINN